MTYAPFLMKPLQLIVCVNSSSSRRYIAMLEMCRIVVNRNRLITLLLLISENVMNIILVHFQDWYNPHFFILYSCEDVCVISALTCCAVEMWMTLVNLQRPLRMAQKET